jgi:hypothetical protein
MAEIDVLKALTGKSPHWSPKESYLESLQEDEEEKQNMDALKSLIPETSKEVSEAVRAPAGVGSEPSRVPGFEPKIVPEYDPETKQAVQEMTKNLINKILPPEKPVPSRVTTKSSESGVSDKKTIFTRGGKPSVGAGTPAKLTAEQSEINNLDQDIKDLEEKRTQKKKEFEDYLDRSVEEMTKKPEGMGLLEVVGKSMLALAPGLIGAKFAGYRGGQYAQEGANKVLEDLMKTEESRREAANKIKSEAMKLKAMLTKEDMDKIGDFQKDLTKGKIDLRLLPIKEKYELSKFLKAKELTKDDEGRFITMMPSLIEAFSKVGKQNIATPPKGEEILSEEKTTKLYDGRYGFSPLDIDKMGKSNYDKFVNKVSATRDLRDQVGEIFKIVKANNGRPYSVLPSDAKLAYSQMLSRVVAKAKELENFGAALTPNEQQILIDFLGGNPKMDTQEIMNKLFADENLNNRLVRFMSGYQRALDISVQDRGGAITRYGEDKKILTPEQRQLLEQQLKKAQQAK